MTTPRQKPSDIAAEAKREWFPRIFNTYIKNRKTSYLYPDSTDIKIPVEKRTGWRTRVAVMEGDPVNYALGWYQNLLTERAGNPRKIPVVNAANEMRPAGDWEMGVMASEECFARRSNLVHALSMPWNKEDNCYPIPQQGGIFSPEIYVFRSGPDRNYVVYDEVCSLPVISVTPVARPKLDGLTGMYSFQQEKELMREKMRAVLRIACYCGHRALVVGDFGLGSTFRNPAAEVAGMWRELLFDEDEFRGVFYDVVFAIDTSIVHPHCLETFKKEFQASKIFPISAPYYSSSED